MNYYLYPPDKLTYLSAQEILRRVAMSFPEALVEVDRADHQAREGYEQLVRLNAPDVVLDFRKAVIGNTAFVAIPLQLHGYLWFQAMPTNPIDIEYLTVAEWDRCQPMLEGQARFEQLDEPQPGEEEIWRPTAEVLASCLGYKIGFEA